MCADAPDCDPTTVVATLTRLSANLFTDNSDIEVDFIFGDYLDGTTCAQECQDNPDCFVFDETVDGECGPPPPYVDVIRNCWGTTYENQIDKTVFVISDRPG